jgi:hypothetical protein
MGCLPECAPVLSELVLADCNQETMSGGIGWLAFLKCTASFSDVSGGGITDLATWQSLLDSGDLVITAAVIGAKPKGTGTQLRTKSCAPERTVSRTKSITFRDYNADLSTLTQYAFWNSIDANSDSLDFLYITCEGYVYGTFTHGTWSLDIDDVRGENVEDPLYMDGAISYIQLRMQQPVFVPDLTTILKG